MHRCPGQPQIVKHLSCVYVPIREGNVRLSMLFARPPRTLDSSNTTKIMSHSMSTWDNVGVIRTQYKVKYFVDSFRGHEFPRALLLVQVVLAGVDIPVT